jgi:hypothetical protein
MGVLIYGNKVKLNRLTTHPVGRRDCTHHQASNDAEDGEVSVNTSEVVQVCSDALGEGRCQLRSSVAAAHFVAGRAFSLAMVPLEAVHPGFDKVLATVVAETGEAVQPTHASLKVLAPTNPSITFIDTMGVHS